MIEYKIDSHQHFWSLSAPWCDWPTANEVAIHKDYAPEDLYPHLKALGINKTILVQAAPNVDETWAMLGWAQRTEFIAGVVGWVDFEEPGKAKKDIAELSVGPYLVGVRPMLQSIEQTDWVLESKFTPIFEALIDRNLVFDALIQPRHLPIIKALALKHPDLKIVINHAAKPNIADGEFLPWADALEKTAQCPNVHCKLSGLLTEARADESSETIKKYIDAIVKIFGPGRILWGSDWPVVELNGDYTNWYEMCRNFIDPLPQSDRQAIFADNAANLYGLTLGP